MYDANVVVCRNPECGRRLPPFTSPWPTVLGPASGLCLIETGPKPGTPAFEFRLEGESRGLLVEAATYSLFDQGATTVRPPYQRLDLGGATPFGPSAVVGFGNVWVPTRRGIVRRSAAGLLTTELPSPIRVHRACDSFWTGICADGSVYRWNAEDGQASKIGELPAYGTNAILAADEDEIFGVCGNQVLSVRRSAVGFQEWAGQEIVGAFWRRNRYLVGYESDKVLLLRFDADMKMVWRSSPLGIPDATFIAAFDNFVWILSRATGAFWRVDFVSGEARQAYTLKQRDILAATAFRREGTPLFLVVSQLDREARVSLVEPAQGEENVLASAPKSSAALLGYDGSQVFVGLPRSDATDVLLFQTEI